MTARVELPHEIRISAPGAALVYPTAGAGRGDRVVGRGEWAFSFDPPDDVGVARVRLTEAAFRFGPGTHVHFDVDGDGLLERLDLSGLSLRREAFDLERSGGTLDVATGDVTFRLVLAVDPHEIPGLERMPVEGPIHFDVTERGRFDLAGGRYRTSSDLLTIPDGPLAGLTFINCWGPGEVGTLQCAATVAVGVSVLSDNNPTSAMDIPAGQAPHEVWICPGTTVNVVWASKNAEAVDISPDIGEVAPQGHQLLPDPHSPNTHLHAAITQSRNMHAKTVGHCSVATDDVTVNVIGASGEWFSQKAVYVDGMNYWSANLPDHTYDAKILVSQVIIDSRAADSVTHPNWRVDHVYDAQTPVGTPIPSLNVPEHTGDRHPLPGEYRFTPQPPGVQLPPGERDRSVHFRLFAEPCE